MTDQGSMTPTAEAQGAEATTSVNTETKTTTTTTDDVLAKFAAKVESLEKDNKAYRDKLRSLTAADEEAKRKAGVYEPILKQRDAELAEMKARLAELEADANLGKSLREQKSSAIAAKAKDLDEDEKALVDAVSDLGAKEKLVDKLLAAKKTGKPSSVPKPAGEKPASSGRVTASEPRKQGFSIF